MSLNGRQKSKLGDLMRLPEPRGSGSMFSGPSPNDIIGAMEPLECLRMLVRMIEEGTLEARTMSVESFRNPQSFRGINGDFQSFMPMDQSMQLSMEIVPTGNSPRSRRPTTNPDDDIGDGIDEALDNDLESPSPAADRALDRAAARLRAKRPKFDDVEKPRKPAAPLTPTGASAAREIIFDDDGSDPT